MSWSGLVWVYLVWGLFSFTDGASMVAQIVKSPLAVQETQVLSLGWKDPLEECNPLQYSCLENPMDRGAGRAAVHGVSKSWTRLRIHTYTHTHTHTHSFTNPFRAILSHCFFGYFFSTLFYHSLLDSNDTNTRYFFISSFYSFIVFYLFFIVSWPLRLFIFFFHFSLFRLG